MRRDVVIKVVPSISKYINVKTIEIQEFSGRGLPALYFFHTLLVACRLGWTMVGRVRRGLAGGRVVSLLMCCV